MINEAYDDDLTSFDISGKGGDYRGFKIVQYTVDGYTGNWQAYKQDADVQQAISHDGFKTAKKACRAVDFFLGKDLAVPTGEGVFVFNAHQITYEKRPLAFFENLGISKQHHDRSIKSENEIPLTDMLELVFRLPREIK